MPNPNPKQEKPLDQGIINTLNEIITEIDRLYKRPLAGATVQEWMEYADGLRHGLVNAKVGMDISGSNLEIALAVTMFGVQYSREIKRAFGYA